MSFTENPGVELKEYKLIDIEVPLSYIAFSKMNIWKKSFESIQAILWRSSSTEADMSDYF